MKNYNTVKILESINKLNNNWHETLSTTIQSFFKEKNQEQKTMVPFIKGFQHTKSFSSSVLHEKTNEKFNDNFENPSEFDQENSQKHWFKQKIASKERNYDSNSFKGSHKNESIENFKNFYDKIQLKAQGSNNTFGFDNALIDNPYAKHLFEMRIRKNNHQEKKPFGFGRYLSEELKKKIQEDYHNNSFFSMNFCRNVMKKKPNLLEKILLENINKSRFEENSAKSFVGQEKSSILGEFGQNSINQNKNPKFIRKIL